MCRSWFNLPCTLHNGGSDTSSLSSALADGRPNIRGTTFGKRQDSSRMCLDSETPVLHLHTPRVLYKHAERRFYLYGFQRLSSRNPKHWDYQTQKVIEPSLNLIIDKPGRSSTDIVVCERQTSEMINKSGRIKDGLSVQLDWNQYSWPAFILHLKCIKWTNSAGHDPTQGHQPSFPSAFTAINTHTHL